jgi:hypothetical protein
MRITKSKVTALITVMIAQVCLLISLPPSVGHTQQPLPGIFCSSACPGGCFIDGVAGCLFFANCATGCTIFCPNNVIINSPCGPG